MINGSRRARCHDLQTKIDKLSNRVKLGADEKNFWLVKQEPSAYSWANLVEDGRTSWTGVRNYTARNNLRRMQKGDEVLFYHSVEEKIGRRISHALCEIAYKDPTAKEGDSVHRGHRAGETIALTGDA